MAKFTIEELFYGDEYGIMGEVVKQVFARQDEFIESPHSFTELETVRQTFIAVEKMKKNGDCMPFEPNSNSAKIYFKYDVFISYLLTFS